MKTLGVGIGIGVVLMRDSIPMPTPTSQAVVLFSEQQLMGFWRTHAHENSSGIVPISTS